MEIYIQPPSSFIFENRTQLLPDWNHPPKILVIVLLQSQWALKSEGELIQVEKDKLRTQFIQFAHYFQSVCTQKKLLTEIIDPQNGQPLNSAKGEISFDIVAVVHQLLNFNFELTLAGCKVLKHPLWNTAVYPGILLSLASPEKIKSILQE